MNFDKCFGAAHSKPSILTLFKILKQKLSKKEHFLSLFPIAGQHKNTGLVQDPLFGGYIRHYSGFTSFGGGSGGS